MAKDPAALFYIDTWLVATAEMDADCRGWYLNLVLHQYDKKTLPNNIEALASLAHVKFSEFQRFKQVFEQVLKQKFKENSEGRLENDTAKDILRKREQFLDKRTTSGKLGYLIKLAKSRYSATYEQIIVIKSFFTAEILKANENHVLEQMLEQQVKLYINGDGDEDISVFRKGVVGEKPISGTFVGNMVEKWKDTYPDTFIADTDTASLMEISKKIHEWQKLPDRPLDNQEQILLRWGEIITHCKADGHLHKYSISQVNKHFSSVIQSFKSNGQQSTNAGGGAKKGTSTGRVEAARKW